MSNIATRFPLVILNIFFLFSLLGLWIFLLPSLLPFFIGAGIIGVSFYRRTESPLLAQLKIFILFFVWSLIAVDLIGRGWIREPCGIRPDDEYRQYRSNYQGLVHYRRNIFFDEFIRGDYARMQSDDTLGQKRRYLFVTDNHGFRNYEQAARPAVDVIFLGDSFFVGAGTSQDHIVSEMLRQKYKLNVYNLSVLGAGPWSEVMNLKAEFQKLPIQKNPIIVWGIFPTNDLTDYYGNTFDVEKIKASGWKRIFLWADNMRKRSFLIKRLQRLRYSGSSHIVVSHKSKNPMLFSDSQIKILNNTRDRILANPNWPSFQSSMEEMHRFANAAGARVLVVHIPSKEYLYAPKMLSFSIPEDNYQTAFAALLNQACKKAGFDFMDLTDPMLQEIESPDIRTKRYLFWEDDAHWNDQGNAFVARLLGEYLCRFKTCAVAEEGL